MQLNKSIHHDIYGTPTYKKALEIRYEVLRKPINMEFSAEELENDKHTIHMVYEDIGTVALRKEAGKTARLTQMAVREVGQGKGIGRKLVEYLEIMAKEQGYEEVVLDARDSAVKFYEALGYKAFGDEFTKIGISHWKMKKKLV